MIVFLLRIQRKMSLRRRCVDENINRTQCYLPLVTYHCFYDSPVKYLRFSLVCEPVIKTDFSYNTMC